ncbi:trypsin-like serine peptidase [Actinomadura algeriensis]|uniref:V8-like Glu-specific endopeptidase n=1 Tax=Actinomadura algeriensis TaxID=1679523 RepID=A0ABR9JNC4_9ACTN|nr:trypsin-like peptidase domain-containing protein [Actinomadura algeriensis]MBE1532052.1 V8-like Glu-specific endopeptidase [Actinomadura algeriensis]
MTRRFTVLGTTLLALATTAPAVATAAQARETPATSPWDVATGSATGSPAARSAAQVQEYWTPERMAAARPTPAPEVSPAEAAASARTAAAEPPVAEPETGDGHIPPAADAGEPAIGTRALTYFSTSKIWAGHGRMPAQTIGKLYYTRNGNGYYCSAATINSSNRNTIWTAGHCVTDGNRNWYSNFTFVPDFHDGTRPHGTWTARSWAAPNGYFDGKNHRYDMAALALNLNNGRRVGDVVGYQGYRFGESYNETTFHDTRAFGYPQNTHPARSGISSNKLRFCVGYAATDALYKRIGCDMGGGSSGGPWITEMPLSRGWGYIIGHNAWHYGNDPWEYGPTLGTAAINVRDAVHTD